MRRLTIFLAVFLTRCEGIKSTLGLDHEGPNEFDAVPLSPLSLPQDFHKTPSTEATIVDLTGRENELFLFVQETPKVGKEAGIKTTELIQKEAKHKGKKAEIREANEAPHRIQEAESAEKSVQVSEFPEAPEANQKVPSQGVSDKNSKTVGSDTEARKNAPRTVNPPSQNFQETAPKPVSLPIVSHPVIEEWEKIPAVGQAALANQTDVLNNSWATVSPSLRLQEPELLVVSDEVIPVKEPPADPRYDRLAEERLASSRERKRAVRKQETSSSPNKLQAESESKSRAIVAALSQSPVVSDQRPAPVARPQERKVVETQQEGKGTELPPLIRERRDMQPILGGKGDSLKKRGGSRSLVSASRLTRTPAVPPAPIRKTGLSEKTTVTRRAVPQENKQHLGRNRIRAADSVQAHSQAFAQPAQSALSSQTFAAPQAGGSFVPQPVISKSQKRVRYGRGTPKGTRKVLPSRQSFEGHNVSSNAVQGPASKVRNRSAGGQQPVAASKVFSQPAQLPSSEHSTRQTIRQPHASQGNTTMRPILSRPSKTFKKNKSKGGKKGVRRRRRYSVRS